MEIVRTKFQNKQVTTGSRKDVEPMRIIVILIVKWKTVLFKIE